MSELCTILLTSCLTVLTGTTLFVIGQIVSKFLIEPILEQRRVIGEIAYSLIFYARDYTSPGLGKRDRMDEASEVLRQHASQLRARTHAIPWYGFWALLRRVRKYEDVLEASKRLIGLSNSIHQGDGLRNYQLARDIEKLLGIRTDR